MAVDSPRVLKVHREAALAALRAGPYATVEEAAAALAQAVIEAQGPTRWVIITDFGAGTAYGPYATPEAARKAVNSGLMLGTRFQLLAMQPVPRKGHQPEVPKPEQQTLPGT